MTTILKQSSRSDLKWVGKVKHPHGIRGELFLLVFSGDFSWIDQLKTLTLLLPPLNRNKNEEESKKKQWMDLKITSLRVHKKGIIAAVEGISNRTEAEKLKGSGFFIPREFLLSKKGNHIFLSEIEHFKVIDLNLGELGKITGFSSNGAQDLLIVTSAHSFFPKDEKREILIPLVPQFVREIRFAQSEIEMDLPQGLLELGKKKKDD